MNEIIMKKNEIIKKKKKAFTLIELIIVLAIMAIIAAIAIPNFMAVRDNSKVKADVQSCAVIQRTVLMLVSDGTIAAGVKDFDITVSGTTVIVTDTTGSTPVTDSTDAVTLKAAFKDVKAPQGKATAAATGTATATKYHIDINATGDVTITTT